MVINQTNRRVPELKPMLVEICPNLKHWLGEIRLNLESLLINYVDLQNYTPIIKKNRKLNETHS